MSTIEALYNKKTFKEQPEDFRIGAIISDGMWYNIPKWRKLAMATEQGMSDWVAREMKSGRLIQAEGGARSYRYPLESVIAWHQENDLPLNAQILENIFPPRIWAGMTEVEGFYDAPLRDVGIVTFCASSKVAREATERLRGIGRVTEKEPGKYRAMGLDSKLMKEILDEVVANYPPSEVEKVYARPRCRRRELVEFNQDFLSGLMTFYRHFGRSRTRRFKSTIDIFIPEHDDQDGQVIMWVLSALEIFDEQASVPFSGYLEMILSRRPYDLPSNALGNELSDFQRLRSRAIKHLTKERGDQEFPIEDICQHMGITREEYLSLYERHHLWLSTKMGYSVNFEDSGEERGGSSAFADSTVVSDETDPQIANKISMAVVNAALDTECYSDAFSLISQVNNDELNIGKVQAVSEEFIQALGVELGIGRTET